MLIRIVIRKERKYSLIRPFWFVTRVDAFIWASEMVFGRMASSQIRSRREDADFWLIDKFMYGARRCMNLWYPQRGPRRMGRMQAIVKSPHETS